MNQEKMESKRRASSVSLDESIEQYSDFVYNGTFSFLRVIFGGILKLICPGCRRQAGEEATL
jgi:hypothetical protein